MHLYENQSRSWLSYSFHGNLASFREPARISSGLISRRVHILILRNVYIFIGVECLPGIRTVCHVLATAKGIMQRGHGRYYMYCVQIILGNIRLRHNPVYVWTVSPSRNMTDARTAVRHWKVGKVGAIAVTLFAFQNCR